MRTDALTIEARCIHSKKWEVLIYSGKDKTLHSSYFSSTKPKIIAYPNVAVTMISDNPRPIQVMNQEED